MPLYWFTVISSTPSTFNELYTRSPESICSLSSIKSLTFAIEGVFGIDFCNRIMGWDPIADRAAWGLSLWARGVWFASFDLGTKSGAISLTS